MLTDILKVLSRKEATLSMSQLALEVGYSLKEIESALEQMEHMGYICREIFGQACSPSCGMNRCSGHCEDCGFHSPETFTFWGLTDKGQTMLNQVYGK
ncbi:winged helix-turn-helix domain-containing protein [Desulfosporosinus meridiei]|uniref:FeoC like transcriptional regulator n=1 Tax=Desulfosporosinus meridiei (strain ATCC BAA-275 / DSM 13257 / KCTC 12902 / NCIMB 13706 / S10) TaxID=768704 RepID=J7ISF8_DESMD|nr:winged helix-turn-helix domain-containing protein [Desulfosporosinus meridiei]AFQ44610.1 FeoC like transcriptional regulator [Desulfosporosinus meridiei DSM 13257]